MYDRTSELQGVDAAKCYLFSKKSREIENIPPTAAALLDRGVARNLFRRGTKQGDCGQKSPSGVQGQSPGGGLRVSPSEAEDIYANNHCSNVLTKNP